MLRRLHELTGLWTLPADRLVQRYGAVFLWVGTVATLAGVYWPSPAETYNLTWLNAAVAFSSGLGLILWFLPEGPLPAIYYFPISIATLLCVYIATMSTGGSQSPLVVTVFSIAAFCALFYPFAASLFIGVLACLTAAAPLLSSYDPAYVRMLAVWLPLLLGTTVFISLAAEALRRRAKENRYLETLARSTEILVKQDLQETLQITVQQVLGATGADSCVLFLLDKERGTLLPRVIHLDPKYYSPEDHKAWEKIEVRIGQGMTGWVAEHRQAVLSGDAERDPRAVHVAGTDYEDASAIVAPMIVGDQLTGVIRATRRGLNQFTPEDLNLLQVLAGQAAVALDQARLYEETAELAMTDPLTGLYNRHYFNKVLEPQLKNADGHSPVGVLMIDIYDFKRTNDTYGHLAGDELLQTVGSLMRRSVRTSDIVVRYGGDEFVVVMPGAGISEALAVKGRIEQAVSHWNALERREDLPTLHLNIGADSAIADNLDELLARADIGMYKSKRTEDRERLHQLLEVSASEREKHAVQSVLVLAKILEMKDPYTRGHSERARRTAMRVADRLGLAHEDVQDIGFGAVLHDIGKIVIPTEILNKPGPLTEEEQRVMRRHPEHGANILGELELLSRVRPIVLHHQERWDGRTEGPHPGYPAGLKGEEIPIGARVIAVVDAFDAMTSNRSYRKALPVETAVEELKRHAGSQFDPHVVSVFLEVLEEQGVPSSGVAD